VVFAAAALGAAGAGAVARDKARQGGADKPAAPTAPAIADAELPGDDAEGSLVDKAPAKVDLSAKPRLGLVVPPGPRLSGKEAIAADLSSGFAELESLVKDSSLPKAYAQAVRPEMYKLPGDRDAADVMLRRTEALLADVSSRPGAKDFAAERRELAALKARAEAKRKGGGQPGRDEYVAFRALNRRIALASPLLDFDSLVFIKRNRARLNHMCDQFLGKHAVPGGGLYVLRGALGPEPKLVDLLANAEVRSGRLKGRKLQGGSPLLCDLSFDGKVIAFAYSECGKAELPDRPGWGVEKCFHLYRINVDGTDLVQLTDGDLNDFDPCWLPNGRICFVSERRGGYGRCHGGRDNPSYTLTSIGPDGGDLSFLSWHESNEWHPSVTNEGLIVYTRWDYVDRGTNQAHHPWVTTVDGRDARAIHGNYPPSSSALHGRPWMEMHVHAIPGSNKYVATAAPHHGQAYGSLVVLNPDVEDDDATSQLRRLTPEAAWPEAEGSRAGSGGTWTTAWPLSENQYLASNYGDLYLIDAFGERHLVYASPDVPAMRPIPLRARPMPALTPHQTATGRPVTGSPAMRAAAPRATVALVNVYDSLLAWPRDVKITSLRVVQVLPQPNRVGGTCTSGTGRTNIREAVGTVPVEADGSALFYAPTDMAVFFQALDDRGLAVQSMRSATYVHPGQRLVCQGCHERRYRAPGTPTGVPLALRREPSELTPEVAGSRPLNVQVLVQPVFDARCNACHAQKKAPAMTVATAKKYVPFYVSPMPFEPSRTLPGKFGAMGSRLLGYLNKSHYGVQLSAEEFRRIAVWADCNAASHGSEILTDSDRRRLAEFAAGGK
jgi:hypothetical protein